MVLGQWGITRLLLIAINSASLQTKERHSWQLSALVSSRYDELLTYLYGFLSIFVQHYGPDSYNKNFIYRSDDWLYNSRWEMLIEHRADVDIVEILSWNGILTLLSLIVSRRPSPPSLCFQIMVNPIISVPSAKISPILRPGLMDLIIKVHVI